jgi:hypothetical protein
MEQDHSGTAKSEHPTAQAHSVAGPNLNDAGPEAGAASSELSPLRSAYHAALACYAHAACLIQLAKGGPEAWHRYTQNGEIPATICKLDDALANTPAIESLWGDSTLGSVCSYAGVSARNHHMLAVRVGGLVKAKIAEAEFAFGAPLSSRTGDLLRELPDCDMGRWEVELSLERDKTAKQTALRPQSDQHELSAARRTAAEAIGHLVQAVRDYLANPHPTDTEYQPLRELYQTVAGRALRAALPHPLPGLEEAGLAIHDVTSWAGQSVFTPQSVANPAATRKWLSKLEDIQRMAKAASPTDLRTADLSAVLTAAEKLVKCDRDYGEFLANLESTAGIVIIQLHSEVIAAALLLDHAVHEARLYADLVGTPEQIKAAGLLTTSLKSLIRTMPKSISLSQGERPPPIGTGEIKGIEIAVRRLARTTVDSKSLKPATTGGNDLPNLFVRLPGNRYRIIYGDKDETVPRLAGLRVVEYLLKQPGKAAYVMTINRAICEGSPVAASATDALTNSEDEKGIDGYAPDEWQSPEPCSEKDLEQAKEAVAALDEQAIKAREGGEHEKAEKLENSASTARQWIREQETLVNRKYREQPSQNAEVEKVRIKLTVNFKNACDSLKQKYGLSELAVHLAKQIDRGIDWKYRPVSGVNWSFDLGHR